MQKVSMATTDAENRQIISVVNQRIYGTIGEQQSEETLDMLSEKARSLGASGVKGVRLAPMVNQDGVPIMMAYGTVYF